MLNNLKIELQNHLEDSFKQVFPSNKSDLSIELEIPTDKSHGEFSCNCALKSSKVLRQSPMEIADTFCAAIQESLPKSPLKEKIAKIEVKKPGFINFYLNAEALCEILTQVFKEKENYGQLNIGRKEKVQIEFVSANPTGPLSVAHARQAAVGDALGNILQNVGFDVKKEYYINDEGNQINLLGESMRARATEILGGSAELPEGGYQGEYIKDMAKEFLTEKRIKDLDGLSKVDLKRLMEFGVEHLLGVIKKDLDDFGVTFDVWAHQSKIATQKNIEGILDYLGEKGFLYEKDGALWFKSTDFGDDKDRVIEKSDNTYTYITPDIVYHKDKYSRGFKKVINIWGPDHHGYIPRLTAAIEALGQDRESLKVLIVQLATIYRAGKPISMSTRRGEYISLREVIDEVGVDAARFFFLMRNISVHLDFDLELAKKETSENPVYYIQYAHARVHSINKKAKETKLKLKTSNFSLLKEQEELDLIKQIGTFPDILVFCTNRLDPYPLVNYLQELATSFHKFYDKHRIVDAEKELAIERFSLANATLTTLANGLRLLGLTTPEQM